MSGPHPAIQALVVIETAGPEDPPWIVALNDALARLDGPEDEVAAAHTIGLFMSRTVETNGWGLRSAVILYRPYLRTGPATEGGRVMLHRYASPHRPGNRDLAATNRHAAVVRWHAWQRRMVARNVGRLPRYLRRVVADAEPLVFPIVARDACPAVVAHLTRRERRGSGRRVVVTLRAGDRARRGGHRPR